MKKRICCENWEKDKNTWARLQKGWEGEPGSSLEGKK